MMTDDLLHGGQCTDATPPRRPIRPARNRSADTIAAMPHRALRRRLLVPCLAAPLVLLGGCVERTIEITSEPSGAIVWLNDREVGRTPVEVEFLYYGVYDVRLALDGYEPLVASGTATPPWWDNVPLDLAAEMSPNTDEAHFHWHYVLEPPQNDRGQLIERAAELRSRTAGDDAAP